MLYTIMYNDAFDFLKEYKDVNGLQQSIERMKKGLVHLFEEIYPQ